jgi:hypothetical protein
MKLSNRSVQIRKSVIPQIRFQKHNLTSFGGLVLFQCLLNQLLFKSKLIACFRHVGQGAYKSYQIFLVLIIHVLLGFRHLRELEYYADDPMVLLTVGLKRRPHLSTVTRALGRFDSKAYAHSKELSTELVLTRLKLTRLPRLTVDFDGSVLWTYSRNTEGTAIGYNPKRRGARGYYPLFATIAQTAQVYDLHHRPGNAHDSVGAEDFIKHIFTHLSAQLPLTKFEARFDSAHFKETTCLWLYENQIEFSMSVPFETHNRLKEIIESHKQWIRINHQWAYFEMQWKPKRWQKQFRFLFLRQLRSKPRKGPIQLDLFVPQDLYFEYRVIITNKTTSPRNILHFHNGRGTQEGIFGELKSDMQMDYLPTRRLLANQMFTMAAIFAHNLTRELQMQHESPNRNTTNARASRWLFKKADSLRRLILNKAGYLSKPQGRLTLTLNANHAVEAQINSFLFKLKSTLIFPF